MATPKSSANKMDPRCKEREKRFALVEKVNMDPENSLFEITALLTMIFSIAGAWMDWKYSAWFALGISFINITNFGPGNDLKQIFSSISISIASLCMLYLKNPEPIGCNFFSL